MISPASKVLVSFKEMQYVKYLKERLPSISLVFIYSVAIYLKNRLASTFTLLV